MAKGLDIGTAYIVSAQMVDKEIKYEAIRDAYLELDNVSIIKTSLKKQQTPFIEEGKKIYAIGTKALERARVMNVDLKRPMSKGILTPGDSLAYPILKAIIKAALGEPNKPGELCMFSIPANPINQDNINNIHHEGVIKGIIESLGYKAQSMNEALSIAYSEAEDNDWSAICYSAGAGMGNVCFSWEGTPVFQFSLVNSGDWIDENVASRTGVTKTMAQAIKESGKIDLSLKPEDLNDGTIDGQVLQAIAIYYKFLLEYIIKNIAKFFNESANKPNLNKPIPLIVAGGTSLAKGFTDLVTKLLQEYPLPFPLAGVKSAKEPLTTVARGLLISALAEEEA